ncbi:MAG: glycosyl hydrolase family 28 protein [Opitutaceae bacterium]
MNFFSQLVRVPLVLLAVIAGVTTRSTSAEIDVSTVANLKPALPVIPERTFKLSDFGAIGNGRALNTAAFKKAITAVEKAGGGKLIVPKGVFLTAPFALCSSLELYLEAGAVIQAPDTFEALGLPNPASFKTQAAADAGYKVPDPLITGKSLHDVAITGPGTIDGSGAHWWAWSERAMRNAAAAGKPGRVVLRRPHLLVFDDVQRLRVADITLTNSPMFHLVPRNLTDLTLERVKVRVPFDNSAPDTVAIDCGPVTRVWIHHCEIDTSDDNIVIKSGGTDILIEDCVIKQGHGISIGSEGTTGIRGVLIRRCTFDGTDNGIRIRSVRGAGGLVDNVRYTDITMKNVPNPIVLQLDDPDNNRPDITGDPTKVSAIRNILIDHVTIQGARDAGVIHGLPESLISGITLRDVTVSAENDFDVRDAEDPVFERVHTTITPAAFREQPKIAE